MKKITMMGLAVMMAWVTMGAFCHRNNTPSDPNKGFLVIGQAQVYNVFQDRYLIYPTGGRYQGEFLSGPGTYGSVSNFNVIESFATYNVTGAKLPGTWRIALGPSFFTQSICVETGVRDVSVNLGSQETVTCRGLNVFFGVQPDTMDALNPPSTVTISGSGIEDTYGMPTIAIYDEFGNVAASATATQTLAGGSPHSGPGIESLTFNGTDLSQVYDGAYSIAINNVNSDGTWTTIGGAVLTIYGNPPPPPDLGGGGGGGCEPQPRDQEQLPCDTYQTY